MAIFVSQVVAKSQIHKRRRCDQHLKTLCQCSSWAGFNYQPISVSIHKVWTNQKLEIPALALSKSDRIASFIKIKPRGNMCIVKCIFLDQIILMVHIPFKPIIVISLRPKSRLIKYCSAWSKLQSQVQGLDQKRNSRMPFY